MKARRALISGITGEDGSYRAELLLSKGYEVQGIGWGGLAWQGPGFGALYSLGLLVSRFFSIILIGPGLRVSSLSFGSREESFQLPRISMPNSLLWCATVLNAGSATIEEGTNRCGPRDS